MQTIEIIFSVIAHVLGILNMQETIVIVYMGILVLLVVAVLLVYYRHIILWFI